MAYNNILTKTPGVLCANMALAKKEVCAAASEQVGKYTNVDGVNFPAFEEAFGHEQRNSGLSRR